MHSCARSLAKPLQRTVVYPNCRLITARAHPRSGSAPDLLQQERPQNHHLHLGQKNLGAGLFALAPAPRHHRMSVACPALNTDCRCPRPTGPSPQPLQGIDQSFPDVRIALQNRQLKLQLQLEHSGCNKFTWRMHRRKVCQSSIHHRQLIDFHPRSREHFYLGRLKSLKNRTFSMLDATAAPE
jgi:hypothetical protein